MTGGPDSCNLDVSLPCLDDECIDWMIKREREHMPRNDYVKRLMNGELDVTLRNYSLHWMIRVCARCDFGDLCLYTAMSYFDRFLSMHELSVSPQQKNNNSWAAQLAALACLSLAAKMQETMVPYLMDLQTGDPKCIFQGKTIHRMEMLVSNRLNWKLKPYTPFSYIDFYLRKMNDGEFPPEPVISKSIRIISSTLKEIKFLEYKPSEIAAAVAIYVSGDAQKLDIDKTLSGFICVEKGRVLKCLELVQEFTSRRGNTDSAIARDTSAMLLLPYSPNGVLEHASVDITCFSFQRITSAESCPSSSSPENKRRKLNNTPKKL